MNAILIKGKRILFVFSFVMVFASLELFTWICLLLDHLLFPGFRKVNITAPVFITGMIRTGTTHLFNSLSLDRKRFTCMKLWEILFAPSIIQRKIFIAIRNVPFLNRWLLFNVAPYIEAKLFYGIINMHDTRFRYPEEDEFVFIHNMATNSLSFAFPALTYFRKYIWFDQKVPEISRKCSMNYYRGTIKRHLYIHGQDKYYLAKSASHTPRLLTLKTYFHDAKVIYLARDPVQVVGSTLSLFSQIRKGFHLPTDTIELKRLVLEISDHWFYYPLWIVENYGEEWLHFVKYKKLVNNLLQTIETLYTKFEYTMTDDYYQLIESISKKEFISKHHYSLEEFDLHDNDIVSRYTYFYHKIGL